MVLARLKKYILLLFLFVFIGNILFVPFTAKADSAGTPTPSSNIETVDLNDQNAISNYIVPQNLTLSAQSKGNRKYEIILTWQKPKEGHGEIIGSKVTGPVIDEFRYNFKNYSIRRAASSGQKVIESDSSPVATIDSFKKTTYSEEIIIPTGYTENITYRYSIQSYYERGAPVSPIYLLDAYLFPAQLKYSSTPQTKTFRADSTESPDQTNVTQYAPFLNPVNASYDTDSKEVKANFSWKEPTVKPDGSPKYKLLIWRKQGGTENMPILDPQETDSTSISNLKVWGEITNGQSVELVASVKATYKNNSNWGFSQRRYFTVAKDQNGNFSVTNTGLGDAPDNSWTNQSVNTTSANNVSASCGCKSITAGDPLTKWFNESICLALCSVSEAMGKFIGWTMTFLLSSVNQGGAYNPSKVLVMSEPKDYLLSFLGVEKTYAKLSDDFSTNPPADKQWITTIWKFSLGIVNTIVVALLIFLAFVNILRIQVDTYALKKILPTLIIAVVLANFSLLICRMIVDFSEVLSVTFIKINPGASFKESVDLVGTRLGEAVGVGLLSDNGIIGGAKTVFEKLITGALTFPLMILSFLLGLIIFGVVGILMLALAFLLYIRIPLVSILVAVSPLAFMAMVLPATQNLFKQWWGLFINWVFMLPVILFLFRIVTLLAPSITKFDLPAYFLAVGILGVSVMVPFKMGGAIMSAWGGWMKPAAIKATKWSGRAADRGIGAGRDWLADKTGAEWLKKIPTPRGMVAGWESGAAESDKEFMSVEGAKGRTGREQLLSGIRLQKRGIIVDEGENRQREIYQATGTALAAAREGNPDNLRRILGNEAKNGDYQKARDAYLGLAAQGQASEADQENFNNLANKKGQSADALVVGTAARALATKAGNPEGYLTSPRTRDEKGDIVNKDLEEQSSELLDQYRRMPGDETDKVTHITRLVKIVTKLDGTVMDRSELGEDPQKHAIAQFLSELGENSKLVIDAGETAVTAAKKYKLDKIDFDASGIKSQLAALEPNIRKNVENVLSSGLNYGNLSIPINFDAQFVANAGHISDNFPAIKKIMDERRKNLVSKLANNPQDINLTNQVQFHDQRVKKMEDINNYISSKDKKAKEWVKRYNDLQKKGNK